MFPSPYHEAIAHVFVLISLLVFMYVRIRKPITPASATRTDHGYWIFPVGLAVFSCLMRLTYLVLSEQILGYPA